LLRSCCWTHSELDSGGDANKMLNLFQELVAALENRQPVAVATIIETKGAVPARHGFKLLMRADGFSEAQLARVRAPVGLDLGGREPGEIALAILAEIEAVRHGGSGRPLSMPGTHAA